MHLFSSCFDCFAESGKVFWVQQALQPIAFHVHPHAWAFRIEETKFHLVISIEWGTQEVPEALEWIAAEVAVHDEQAN